MPPTPGSHPVPSPPPRVPLRGSGREPLRGARRIAQVPDDESLTVTVLVRRRAGAPPAGGGHPPLSREEFTATMGADPADLEQVVTFAHRHGLAIESSDPARRGVILTGTAAQFGSAFGVRLGRYSYDGGTYRGREGTLVVPTSLAGIVEGVFGLDDRPAARPHPPSRPADVGRPYHFPTGMDLSGQTVATIELDGGDLDGVQVVDAAARGVTIVVYVAGNTDRGFIDAVTTAIHDRTHRPTVLSIGWGAPEETWSAQSTAAFNAAFADAAALGVTVLAAAGDDGQPGDDFPASSPHVTARAGMAPLSSARSREQFAGGSGDHFG
jgi:kumamolisin